MINSKEIIRYMTELEEDKLFDEIQKALNCIDSEKAAKGIITDCQIGMTKVGELFQNREYFIGDLIYSGELFKDVTTMLKPFMKNYNQQKIGKIVLGTVHGDLHDIGKNIFRIMAENEGFEVHDIGTDKSPAQFLRKIEEVKPNIVGLSGVLMMSIESMRETIELICKSSIEDNFKIIVGGNVVSEAVCNYIKADAFTTNAQEGVDICLDWMRNDITTILGDKYSKQQAM